MKKKKPAAVPVIDLEPVAEVVAALSRMLVEARAGNVRAVAIAYVTDTAPYTNSTSGVGMVPPDVKSAKLLSGAIRELDHAWLHALRGS